ncbi:MFS general substrate transporter [Auriculariales sp. MPI-PUGE-AT-0066]|nr:MFS general substrate transporter [Auriculariales sp. MPI-PUGE-AT-0066]
MSRRGSRSPSLTEDERTPLIRPINGVTAHDDASQPLPFLQVTLLCAGRCVEGVAFFAIFPFINEMIHKTAGVPKDEVGFWSGLIESMFSFTQMLVMIFWGRASDRVGRKPILVFCLVGLGLSVAAFGFARSKWEMLLLRSLAGVFGGTVVTIRTMLSENSTPLTQARAFSSFAVASNLGIFIGPIIGGALSNPATQYQHSPFSRWQLFTDFPYVLPGLVNGTATLLVALACSIFLKETLPSRGQPSVPGEHPTAQKPTMTTWEVIMAPGVRAALATFLYAGMLGFCFTAIIPVYSFTPVDMGGLGFTPPQISGMMAALGLAQATWMVLIFPPLQKRIGTGSLLKYCAAAWPLAFLVVASQNVLLRTGHDFAFRFVLVLAAIVPSGIAMAFAGVQLLLNDASPSAGAFGTLNGVALSLQSATRAISPAVASSIYAWGVSRQILWGLFGWVFLIVLASGFRTTLFRLPAKSKVSPLRAELERQAFRAAEEGRPRQDDNN